MRCSEYSSLFRLLLINLARNIRPIYNSVNMEKRICMKRALSLALIASMVLGAMFTGCSQDGVAASTPAETSSEASAKENTGKKNVVLILKNLTNPMWVEVKEGAEEAAQKAGVNLTTLAPVQSENNDEQISEIEQSISKGVDAI
ncbi:MAG: hypothetical protein E7519_09960, partial [Ruminococcaceae bacterium]|nr:hypothetical protein [Oscillospiraceae bacterium]